MDGSTKRATLDDLLAGQARYRRFLVTDLLSGAVSVPAGWLEPGDATLLALDPDLPLDPAQLARFADLARAASAFVGLVDLMIREDVRSRRANGTLSKNDADSLVRGRGPARVRDLLFSAAEPWPSRPWPGLARDVAAVLHRATADREAGQSAGAAAAVISTERLGRLVRPLIDDTVDAVQEWGERKHLPTESVDWVLSEVVDQLIRTTALTGPPDHVRRWALVTTKRKWQATSRAPFVATLDDEPDRGTVADLAEDVATRVDLEGVLDAASATLRGFATAHRARGSVLDAQACAVAASLLASHDVERLVEVARSSPAGVATIRAALERNGFPPEHPTVSAVVRYVRDSVRRVLESTG